MAPNEIYNAAARIKLESYLYLMSTSTEILDDTAFFENFGNALDKLFRTGEHRK